MCQVPLLDEVMLKNETVRMNSYHLGKNYSMIEKWYKGPMIKSGRNIKNSMYDWGTDYWGSHSVR